MALMTVSVHHAQTRANSGSACTYIERAYVIATESPISSPIIGHGFTIPPNVIQTVSEACSSYIIMYIVIHTCN